MHVHTWHTAYWFALISSGFRRDSGGFAICHILFAISLLNKIIKYWFPNFWTKLCLLKAHRRRFIQMNTLLRKKRLQDVVDNRCRDVDSETAEAILRIAVRCTDADPQRRPLMSEVLQFLEQEVMSPSPYPSDFYESHSVHCWNKTCWCSPLPWGFLYILVYLSGQWCEFWYVT